MNILEIIAKKRDNKILSKEEIEYFIENYTKGEITDYQAAALVMAIYINGMDYEETKNLTIAMANSGKKLDLSDISDTIIDKHSSGGVGDKITLIVMPIVASFGIPVAKMSGRGLGITGGTIDKLESIPGYRTNLSLEEFKNNIKEIGIGLIGQTENLAPADKKIYALRNSISAVDNMPLIASSIMSKKIASGANKLVLEVTCGSGAFMKNKEEAKELSNIMVNIGKLSNIETTCVITNMEQPIGKCVGNSLELEEAIKALKGEMQEDVKEIVLCIASQIMKLAGISNDLEKNKNMIIEKISNGEAYSKFIELVKKQGGDIEYLNHIEKAKYIVPVISKDDGYITKLDAETIGKVALALGAGRIKKEDNIDHTCGVVLEKKIGDKIKNGEILAYIHSNKEEKLDEAVKMTEKAYKINKEKPEKYVDIIDII